MLSVDKLRPETVMLATAEPVVYDLKAQAPPPPAGVCIVGAAPAPLLVNTCPAVHVATAAGLPLAS